MQRLGFEASNQLIFNLNVKWRWGPWAWGWADVGPEGESSEDHHVAQSELSSYRGGQPFKETRQSNFKIKDFHSRYTVVPF